MQTLRPTHRLGLRLIGVSGGAIAKESSGMWSPEWRQLTFVDNFWSELLGQIISSSAYSSVAITKNNSTKIILFLLLQPQLPKS